MYSWRHGRPTVVLPWRKDLIFMSFLFQVSLGTMAGISVWDAPRSIHGLLLPLFFLLCGLILFRCLRHGVAVIKDAQVSVWSWVAPEMISLNAALKRQTFWGGDEAFMSCFRSALQDEDLRRRNSDIFPALPKTLNVDGFSLRPWDRKEFNCYRRLFQDRELMQWHQMDVPSQREMQNRLAKASAHLEYRRVWSYAIECSSKHVIGHVEMHLLSYQAYTFELSFGLHRAYRNQGTMRCILKRLLAHWFACHHVQTVYARTRVDNTPCLSLLRHLGFDRASSMPTLWVEHTPSRPLHFFVLNAPTSTNDKDRA